MIAVILVIADQASRANRHGALALSDDVLDTLDVRIAEQVLNYFGSPTRALSIDETLGEERHPANSAGRSWRYFRSGHSRKFR